MPEPLLHFLGRIEEPVLWTVQLEEAERETVLLGLAALRQARPGWEYVLRGIEGKLGGAATLSFSESRFCYRCQKPKPDAQLVTTETGGRYCLACIQAVEICRGCGCTDEVACPGGCSWAAPGVCSHCEGQV